MSAWPALLAVVALAACTKVPGRATVRIDARVEDGRIVATSPTPGLAGAWEEFHARWRAACSDPGDVVIDRVTIATEPALPLERVFRDRVVVSSLRPVSPYALPPYAPVQVFPPEPERYRIATGRALRGHGPAALHLGEGQYQLPSDLVVVKGKAATGAEHLLPFQIVVTFRVQGDCGSPPPESKPDYYEVPFR